MLASGILRRLTMCSLTAFMCAQGVFAHTGVREQATESLTSYNGFTITHGCGSDTGGDPLKVKGQSAVFPFGDNANTVWVDLATNTVIPTGGIGIVDLPDPPAPPVFSLNPGGIQSNDPFFIQEEETADGTVDTPVRALNWKGGPGLKTNLVGIPLFRVSAPTIVDACVSKLRVRIAVVNWCEKQKNEANDADNNRADWWFPTPLVDEGEPGAPGSGSDKFVDPDLVQEDFWTTLTVNNVDRADPANCPGGVHREVAVQPSGADIDTFLPYKPFTKGPGPY